MSYTLRKIIRLPETKKSHIAIIVVEYEDGKKESQFRTLCGSHGTFHPRFECPRNTEVECKICAKMKV